MNWIKKIFPFLFCVGLLFFEKMPFSFSVNNQVNLPLIYIAIFYFSLFLPEHFGVLSVFFLGLLADFLTPAFFGLQTFFLVSVYFIVSLMRSLFLKLKFETLWFVFALILLCSDIVFTFFLILFSPIHINVSYFVVQYIVLVLFFPVFTILCKFIVQKVR